MPKRDAEWRTRERIYEGDDKPPFGKVFSYEGEAPGVEQMQASVMTEFGWDGWAGGEGWLGVGILSGLGQACARPGNKERRQYELRMF